VWRDGDPRREHEWLPVVAHSTDTQASSLARQTEEWAIFLSLQAALHGRVEEQTIEAAVLAPHEHRLQYGGTIWKHEAQIYAAEQIEWAESAHEIRNRKQKRPG